MAESITTDELSHWYSTYGIITSERILGHYKITLPQSELIEALKTPISFYRQLLQVPLQHVLNGIVMQQAGDYHLYAQKLFIDYLLSGESGKSPEEQGASTRESLEEHRQELVKMGEDYNRLEIQHDNLIASSQTFLIQFAKEWNVKFEACLSKLTSIYKTVNSSVTKELVQKAMNHALIYSGIGKSQGESEMERFIVCLGEVLNPVNEQVKQKILDTLADLFNYLNNMKSQHEEFIIATEEDGVKARSFRVGFYEKILRVTELIKMLSDYKIDPVQDAINREALHFDRTLGNI